MWRGQGRSFGRSADAASGGYEQWPQQARGDPSMELAARYAVPAGFGAPTPTAMAPPAAMPPGVYGDSSAQGREACRQLKLNT